MGDRCFVKCCVRPEDAERMENLLDGALQQHNSGRYRVLTVENAADGADDGLVAAANEGLVFYGFHTAGEEYPASVFASDGDGELYAVECIWVGDLVPVLRLGYDGDFIQSDYEGIRVALAVRRSVQAQAYPTEPVIEKEFGEKLERQLGLLSNQAIIDELGLHKPENMGRLLDYIRDRRSNQ